MSQRKLIAKNKVTKANIKHVHMTGSPAVPDATFVLTKSMEEGADETGLEEINTTALFKTDPVKKQVFGYCLVPDVPDRQGDVFEKSVVENACHSLLKNLLAGAAEGEGSGVDHKIFKGGYVIESCIDADGSIAKAHGAQGIPGGWWLGVQVTDDAVWTKVEKGEITGFTVGGRGVREPIQKSTTEGDGEETAAERGLFKRFMGFLSNISKADGDAETYNEKAAQDELRSKLWKKVYTLEDALMSIVWDDTVTDKAAAITQSIGQFQADFIATVQAAQTAKANANNNGVQKSHTTEGEDTMDKAQMEALTKSMKELTAAMTTMIAKMDGAAADGEGEKPKADGKPEGEVKKGGEGEANAELTKTVADLNTTVVELKAKLEKFEKGPQHRRGASDTEPIAKEEGKESELAKAAKGTPFSFRTDDQQ